MMKPKRKSPPSWAPALSPQRRPRYVGQAAPGLDVPPIVVGEQPTSLATYALIGLAAGALTLLLVGPAFLSKTVRAVF